MWGSILDRKRPRSALVEILSEIEIWPLGSNVVIRAAGNYHLRLADTFAMQLDCIHPKRVILSRRIGDTSQVPVRPKSSESSHQ